MERYQAHMPSPLPTYQIYGRRKGKPLRQNHLSLMDELLPRVTVDLGDPLAGTQARRWLEIGFGGGEHLAHQAALHPDVSIIGAEPYLNGVAKLLAEIESRNLANVHVHYGDARPLLDALPEDSFERIYLLYPDPWPKERQKKRRFISPSNLKHFHCVLRTGGFLHVASDIPDYIDWTLSHISASGLFTLQSKSLEPYPNWTSTRYEAKALREGRVPQYLTYKK
jgi:tRNA (guanine-N7-)-methyltransferase